MAGESFALHPQVSGVLHRRCIDRQHEISRCLLRGSMSCSDSYSIMSIHDVYEEVLNYLDNGGECARDFYDCFLSKSG